MLALCLVFSLLITRVFWVVAYHPTQVCLSKSEFSTVCWCLYGSFFVSCLFLFMSIAQLAIG